MLLQLKNDFKYYLPMIIFLPHKSHGGGKRVKSLLHPTIFMLIIEYYHH